MLLGQAYSKYLEAVAWLAVQLDFDEAKAPGLGELAWKFSNTPGSVQRGLPATVSIAIGDMHERLLQEAISMSIGPRHAASLIEHDDKA